MEEKAMKKKSEKASYYMILTIMTFLKSQNYEDRKKISGYQGLWGRKRWNTEGF